MIAEVIINNNARALNRIFDYKVPKELETKIKIGSRVFVPFGNGKKLDDGFVINLKDKSEFECKEIAGIEKDSLSEFNVNLAKLMARKYFCNISECIKLMLPPGTTSKELSNREKAKVGNFVFLNKDKDVVEADIEAGLIKSDKHKTVLRYFIDNNIEEGIYISDLEVFTGVSKAVFKTIAKNGYIAIKENEMERNPFLHKAYSRDKKKKLNEEQIVCFECIKSQIDEGRHETNLIYGITGSGKTEIYLQLIEEVLNKGKTAIVLVPEISLTPQMVDRFLSRFGEEIAVLHSKLSSGERFDEWNKIKDGKAKIVIGARSAIFAPVSNLGIIIIDEEHDASYKSENTPRYNAKDLAYYIAKQNNVPLVLGSATPDITSFYKAKNGDIKLFTLTKRATNAKLPEVKIVDLRYELSHGNKSMISLELQEAMKKNLKNKKQTILFLNRRGYSTFIMCRECGYVAKCKNCDIPLTYHRYGNSLKCHYCGYEQSAISICPNCGSNKVKYFGTGTQKLEDEVKELFPGITTIRMDIDTVGKKNSYEEILNSFRDEKIDVLIGTQMVVKGHHFPDVTLVGVIAADGNLYQDDYKAVERGFQTLVQVSGRSGRTEHGDVIIQTYNPDHYAIIDSQKQDYDLFYNQEINLRKMLNYPPFCDIIVIRFLGKNLSDVKKVANSVYSKLEKIVSDKELLYNPVPSPIERIQNKYRWRIIIKAKLTNSLIDKINFAANVLDYKNKDVSIIVDSNPNNMV